VFTVTKGESIGYGRSFFADRDMRVATVTTGYADGYPRALSNVGKIIINGSRCPIVGRICMDMMMADVTDVPKVSAGDTAVLIGRSGDENITADHIASYADTISYEILTGISSRVKRVYK
jgi:alanine racemase